MLHVQGKTWARRINHLLILCFHRLSGSCTGKTSPDLFLHPQQQINIESFSHNCILLYYEKAERTWGPSETIIHWNQDRIEALFGIGTLYDFWGYLTTTIIQNTFEYEHVAGHLLYTISFGRATLICWTQIQDGEVCNPFIEAHLQLNCVILSDGIFLTWLCLWLWYLIHFIFSSFREIYGQMSATTIAFLLHDLRRLLLRFITFLNFATHLESSL